MRTKSATAKPATPQQQFKPADVFSEMSHYRYINPSKTAGKVIMMHIESNEEVELDEAYVRNLLMPADWYEKEMVVGKEDKYWTEKQITEAEKAGELTANHLVRPGDVRLKGIRTIFEEIRGQDILMLCFVKQDKPLSEKKFNELKAAQITAAVEAITKVQKNKEGVAKAAEVELRRIQDNIILPYEKGEERILRGYKNQFYSRDGYYDCIDLDLDPNEKSGNVRPVNINTLKWLVHNKTMYRVE